MDSSMVDDCTGIIMHSPAHNVQNQIQELGTWKNVAKVARGARSE